MFNKPKSAAFIAEQKGRSGKNNPMYGKPKSEETLAKLKRWSLCMMLHKNINYSPSGEPLGLPLVKKKIKIW